MPRFKLTIEYDGTPFCGWQSQPNRQAVQDKVEDAIEKLCGARVSVQAAGRTDSGVHALGQVIHCDITRACSAYKVAQALNHFLKPDPVVIVASEQVSDRFEARFSARARHYEYRILNRIPRSALEPRRAWHVAHPLNERIMHDAGQRILGKHDFSTFRASICQARSPVRTLDRLDVTRDGDTVIITASAQSFLHNQVRSLVGSLKLVGQEKWTPADFRAALDAADRAACGPVAPAHGLYLTQVDY